MLDFLGLLILMQIINKPVAILRFNVNKHIFSSEKVVEEYLDDKWQNLFWGVIIIAILLGIINRVIWWL